MSSGRSWHISDEERLYFHVPEHAELVFVAPRPGPHVLVVFHENVLAVSAPVATSKAFGCPAKAVQEGRFAERSLTQEVGWDGREGRNIQWQLTSEGATVAPMAAAQHCHGLGQIVGLARHAVASWWRAVFSMEVVASEHRTARHAGSIRVIRDLRPPRPATQVIFIR